MAERLTEPANRPNRWLLGLLIGAILVGALLTRLALAVVAEHPGHADHAHYYILARNLASGRGYEIDYIWHFLSHPTGIPTYSNDYWMPFASVLISLALRLFDHSLRAALLPSIVLGMALAVPTYQWGMAYARSRWVAWGAVALVWFNPLLYKSSLLTDTAIYFVFFAVYSLYCMTLGWRKPRYFVVAGGLAGLAHLTRQDGVLLLVTLLAVISSSPQPARVRRNTAGAALLVYVLVLAPLLVGNLRSMGTPLPSGSMRTMFATEYEDIYTYKDRLTLENYLDQGLNAIVRYKGEVAVENGTRLQGLLWNGQSVREYVGSTRSFYLVLSYVLWGLLIVEIAYLVRTPALRNHRELYLPLALYFEFLFLFYTVVASATTEGGGFRRSALTIVPFLAVMIVNALARVIKPRLLAEAVYGVLLAFLVAESFLAAENTLAVNRDVGAAFERVGVAIEADSAQRDIAAPVLMARDPWEASYSTGFPAVQIPNDDLATILVAAQRYDVTYILLPAPRADLEPIFSGEEDDLRFVWIATLPGTSFTAEYKLYYLDLPR